jgi:L-alanine-DL-glutamate epimerase-like enolase superfamily enzyme
VKIAEVDVLAEPLSIDHDIAQVPDGPGLGIEVDPAKVAALPRGSQDVAPQRGALSCPT